MRFFTPTYDDVRPADLRAMRGSDQAKLVLGRTSCLTYWAPDNRTVTDGRVRLALAWAHPYRAMLRIDGLVPGVTALPASTIEPPGTPRRRVYRVDGHAPWHTSPARARQLLAEAHALGRPIRFTFTPGDPTSVRGERALVRALRAAGFTVDVRTSTWCGDLPTGSAFLPPLLGTTPHNRFGSLDTNLAAFSRASVDRRFRAIAERPLDQMPDLWTRLERTVMARWFPLVPIASEGVAMAHGVRIRGMVDDPLLGMPDWKSLWVRP